jgi:hypothetical protein
MSASDHLGPQFKGHVRVFRGIANTSELSDINFNNLGKHWTTNPEIAVDFASYYSDNPGHVVTGLVHPDDVLSADNPEHQAVLRSYRLRAYENETPIRAGAQVGVVSVEKYQNRKSVTGPTKYYKKATA